MDAVRNRKRVEMFASILALLAAGLLASQAGAQTRVLVLGGSQPYQSGIEAAFPPSGVASNLQGILSGDVNVSSPVTLQATDTYQTNAASIFTARTLMSWYYWPYTHAATLGLLASNWNYVVMIDDPHVASTFPEYDFEGVMRISRAASNATPVLVMPWSSGSTPLSKFGEMTYRVGDGLGVAVAPAGYAWSNVVSAALQDAGTRPTARGAYVTAATVYSRLFNRSAKTSTYIPAGMDQATRDALADIALTTVQAEATNTHYTGTLRRPTHFASPADKSRTIVEADFFSSTEGWMSEPGIRTFLFEVLNDTKINSGYLASPAKQSFPTPSSPINFCMSRFYSYSYYHIPDTNYWRNYASFDYQDDNGDTTMITGMDRVMYPVPKPEQETGAASVTDAYMNQGEFFVPLRVFWPRIQETLPGMMGNFEKDGHHMTDQVLRGIGSMMATLLMDRCPLTDPPTVGSASWTNWVCKKVGYEIVSQHARLRPGVHGFQVRPSSISSVNLLPYVPETMTVRLHPSYPPLSNVTVTVSLLNATNVTLSTTNLTFTPATYTNVQTVMVVPGYGLQVNNTSTVQFATQSVDPAYNGVTDGWPYNAVPCFVWNGGGANLSWNTGGNWINGLAPSNNPCLIFAGSNGLAPSQGLNTGFTASAIGFDSAAGAFAIGGYTINLGYGSVGRIYFTGNPATPITQTISCPVSLQTAITVDTPTHGNLLLSGAITSYSSLNISKTGPGVLTLSGTSTFAGQLSIQNGTLSVATINNDSANGPLGNSTNSVLLGSAGNTAVLQYNGSTAGSTKRFILAGSSVMQVTNAATILTLGGTIDGSGDLAKAGPGTLVLTGNKTYTGATTVTNGTLVVNGTLASGGTVTVVSGGTLSGTGTITRAVSIQAGGILAPGNPAGVLTIANAPLVLDSGAVLNFNLGINSGLVACRDLTVAGTLSVTNTGGFGSGVYLLFAYSGTLINNGLTVNNPLPGGTTGTIDTSIPGQVRLLVTGGATASTNANLANLVPSVGTISPAFASNTFSYAGSVTYATTNMTVTPTASDPNAIVTVNGKTVVPGASSDLIALSVGANVITTVVTAQDGVTTQTYILTVTRPASGGDAYLSGLAFSAGTFTPTFASCTFGYAASVSYLTTNLTVMPVAQDSNASITVNGLPVASGSTSTPVSVSQSTTLITTVVISQDLSATNTYTVTVTRGAAAGLRWWDGGTTDLATTGDGSSQGGDGTWNTTTMNWDQGADLPHAPWFNFENDTAVFGGIAGTVTLGTGVTVGGIQFDVAGYNIQSNIVTFGTNGTIAANANATIASVIAGSAPVAKTGTGILTLSGNNTLTGQFSVQAGAVVATTNWIGNGRALQKAQVGGASAAALWTNTTDLVVGTSAASSNNTFTVDNQGTLLVNGAITIGTNSAVRNSLVATNGGQIVSSNVTIGAAASGNAMTVSGGTVTNAGTMILGYTASPNISGNTLTVNNGGRFYSGPVYVGDVISSGAGTVYSSNNTYNVGGVGAASFASNGTIYVGYSGGGRYGAGYANMMNVSNATLQVGGTLYVGYVTPLWCTANGNGVTVGAQGTVQVLGGNGIIVGVSYNSGSTANSNFLVVTDGGQLVTTGDSFVGDAVGGGAGNASNDTATVTGSNSLWNLGGKKLTVGYVGKNNAVTVSDGGVLTNAGLVTVGSGSGSLNNSMLVSNAAVWSTGLTIGSSSAGNGVTVNNGVWNFGASNITVGSATALTNALTVTSGGMLTNINLLTCVGTSNRVALSGGTLSASSTVYSNGTDFVVGDGTSAATLRLNTGNHVFQNNLVVTNNGVLIASGTLTSGGSVAITSGGTLGGTGRVGSVTLDGTLAPGNSVGTLTVSNLTLSASSVLAYELGTNSDQTVVTGTLTAAGTVNVTDAGGFTGTTYTLFTYGTLNANTLSVGTLPGAYIGSISNDTAGKRILLVVAEGAGNASLANLAPSAGALSPAFAGGTFSYSMNVPYSVANLTVTPTAANPAADIKVNGATVASGTASGPISLDVGANIITTVVVSQDFTTTNTYTLTVTRAVVSSNANLANLVPSAGTLSPTFAGNTFSYTAAVSYATGSMTVTPTAADASASIKVDGTPVTSGTPSGAITLNVGRNVITTVVIAEDLSTTNTYTLTVSRAAPSANAWLSNLVPSTGMLSPTFVSNTFLYAASVSNSTTSLTVTPTAADPAATIKVNGTTVASGAASGSIALNAGANAITTVVVSENLAVTNTYTLTMMRLGSAGAWSPASLTNLALWLDASDASTVVTNGSTVSQWNDKSGNGRNVAQSNASKQPTYTLAGQNGKNILTFDGNSRSLFATSTVINLAQPFSRFIAAQFLTKANQSVLMDSESVNVQCVFYNGESGANWVVANGLGPSAFASFAYGTRDFLNHQHFAMLNGASSYWGLDGSTPTIAPNSPGAQGQVGIRIGHVRTELSGTYPFNGRIYEIIEVNGVIADSDRQKVEGYLAWKWGMQANLPAGHPYKNESPGGSGGALAIANQPATGITATSAAFNGVLSAFGANADVRVFWGPSDGTNNPAAWTNRAYVGSWTNVGAVNLVLATNGLTPGVQYYYTFAASNSVTNVWATPSTRFVTLPDIVPLVAGFTTVPTNGYAPLQVVFTDTSSGSITNRHWAFGDGGLFDAAGQTSVTNLYTNAGVYSVTLEVSGNGGISTNTLANLVTVLAVPVPMFSGTHAIVISPVSGGVGFQVPGQAGLLYRMAFNDNLLLTNWLPVTPPFPYGWTNGGGGVMTLQDTNTAGITQRFYRIESKSPDAP